MTVEISRRIAALERRLVDPLQKRLERLHLWERAQYHVWKRGCAEWSASFDNPADAYASTLDADEGPTLPTHIDRKLFGTQGIRISDSEEMAAEKYRAFCEIAQ